MTDARRRDDEFLTRREAEVLLAAGRAAGEEGKETHQAQHEAEQLALQTALAVSDREWKQHDEAHAREHVLHGEKHGAEGLAVQTALEAVARERAIHAEAHEREHLSHNKVHDLNQMAVGKAESSVEERLKGMNDFRGQLRDQQATFVSREVVDNLAREIDRRFTELNTTMLTLFQSAEKLTQERFETNRASIIELQKMDVKGAAKGEGYSAFAGWIIAGFGLVATVLGIVIVVSNVLTST